VYWAVCFPPARNNPVSGWLDDSITFFLFVESAHTVLSPSVRVIIVQCNTHVTACLAGYALAEVVPGMNARGGATLRQLCILFGIFISVFVLASGGLPVEDLVGVLSYRLASSSRHDAMDEPHLAMEL
jgi:hypothetical protein